MADHVDIAGEETGNAIWNNSRHVRQKVSIVTNHSWRGDTCMREREGERERGRERPASARDSNLDVIATWSLPRLTTCNNKQLVMMSPQ